MFLAINLGFAVLKVEVRDFDFPATRFEVKEENLAQVLPEPWDKHREQFFGSYKLILHTISLESSIDDICVVIDGQKIDPSSKDEPSGSSFFIC